MHQEIVTISTAFDFAVVLSVIGIGTQRPAAPATSNPTPTSSEQNPTVLNTTPTPPIQRPCAPGSNAGANTMPPVTGATGAPTPTSPSALPNGTPTPNR